MMDDDESGKEYEGLKDVPSRYTLGWRIFDPEEY